MTLKQADLARKIADAMAAQNAAFMFGAGISLHRQTGSPDWKGMVTELIRNIAADCIRNPVPCITPHLGLLFNETFFQIMSQTLSPDQTHEAINACLNAPSPSHIHRFAAWSAKHFRTKLLTTNFDELIEAFDCGGKNRRPLKLHGTLSNPLTLRFRTDSVFAPLDPDLHRRVANAISGRVLVVAGYGGWDIHDVMPAIFRNTRHAKEILWVRHADDVTHPPEISQFFDERTQIVTADIDTIFQVVFRRLISTGGVADEALLNWGFVSESCDDPFWWVRNASTWASRLRHQDATQLRLLWARLANHLRLYKVTIDGETRNLADEAYESILDLDDLVLQYEARSQAAYMGRIDGRSKQAAADLKKLTTDLKRELSVHKGTTRTALRKRLGWSQHQRGVALQHQKRFLEADKQLGDGVQTRRRLRDPDLLFTEFQRYMNGRVALESGQPINPEYYDLIWQETLAQRLDQAAEEFRGDYQMQRFGDTLHNAAFVFQSMSADAIRCGHGRERSLELATFADQRYRSAARIRESMRDPRMIVQSKVRLAQVSLWRAIQTSYAAKPLSERLESCESLLQSAKNLTAEIERIYATIPREEVRREHVKSLQEDCEQYSTFHFPPERRDWFPEESVDSVDRVDRQAMKLRDDPERGWHLAVVTAVFDASGRNVLLVKLGNYGKRKFSDFPWVLPGGSVDPGESPSNAAIRESKEEAGLDLSVSSLRPLGWFGRPDLTPHHRDHPGELLILFGAKTSKRRPKLEPNPPEVLEARWIPVDLQRWASDALSDRYGGVFPAHHMYWARVAQTLLKDNLSHPRFMIYDQNRITTKPWLRIERAQFEVEAFHR